MLTHFYVVNFPIGFKYKIYFILRNILLIPFLHIHPINIFELFFLSIFSHLIYREREKFLAVILPIVHFPKIILYSCRVFFEIVSGLRNIVHSSCNFIYPSWKSVFLVAYVVVKMCFYDNFPCFSKHLTLDIYVWTGISKIKDL